MNSRGPPTTQTTPRFPTDPVEPNDKKKLCSFPPICGGDPKSLVLIELFRVLFIVMYEFTDYIVSTAGFKGYGKSTIANCLLSALLGHNVTPSKCGRGTDAGSAVYGTAAGTSELFYLPADVALGHPTLAASMLDTVGLARNTFNPSHSDTVLKENLNTLLSGMCLPGSKSTTERNTKASVQQHQAAYGTVFVSPAVVLLVVQAENIKVGLSNARRLQKICDEMFADLVKEQDGACAHEIVATPITVVPVVVQADKLDYKTCPERDCLCPMCKVQCTVVSRIDEQSVNTVCKCGECVGRYKLGDPILKCDCGAYACCLMYRSDEGVILNVPANPDEGIVTPVIDFEEMLRSTTFKETILDEIAKYREFNVPVLGRLDVFDVYRMRFDPDPFVRANERATLEALLECYKKVNVIIERKRRQDGNEEELRSAGWSPGNIQKRLAYVKAQRPPTMRFAAADGLADMIVKAIQSNELFPRGSEAEEKAIAAVRADCARVNSGHFLHKHATFDSIISSNNISGLFPTCPLGVRVLIARLVQAEKGVLSL